LLSVGSGNTGVCARAPVTQKISALVNTVAVARTNMVAFTICAPTPLVRRGAKIGLTDLGANDLRVSF
jgi:hypothetical protein